MKSNEIKKIVQNGYAKIAKGDGSYCSGGSCCSGAPNATDLSKNVGYKDGELKAIPEGANLGLGCGNPTALASLRKGETVLDLGSGGGIDCFLAARKVGPNGRVIGVDMTPEMVEKARQNAEKGGYKNVEFRLGEIEDLPVSNDSIDVIISNCVINLSPDKQKVFREAIRVLKPGGRIMISDLVLLKPLPEEVRNSIEAYIGCLSGAILREDYIRHMKEAGFGRVKVLDESGFPIENMMGVKNSEEIAASIVSVKISAEKKYTHTP